MKNKLKKFFMIFFIFIIVVVIGSIAGFFILKEKVEEGIKLEYVSYGNQNIIDKIDKQLEFTDLKKIKEKETFIKEKSISEIQQLVKENKITYEEITGIYLYRIKEFDQSKKGLNSVIDINEDAIKQAKKCDKEKLMTSSVYGIPVLLKDNINTNNMITSAGTVALETFIPSENASLVNSLKSKGAIILGKNNLSEFANFMSYSNPSGFSNRKGQVMNPYGPLQFSPLGSSSGSAVSVASNLTMFSIGTETTGSIVAPAAVQNVVGFRPTKGNISDDGIIPLATTLDSAGPIAKKVKDVAIAYNAMNTTEDIDLQKLDKNYLKNKTILMVKQYKDIDNRYIKLQKEIEKTGANIKYVELDTSKLDSLSVIISEFNKDLDKYLVENKAPYKSLKEIVEFNKKDKEKRAIYGQELLELAIKGNDLKKDDIQNSVDIAKKLLEENLDENTIAIAYINSDLAQLPCFAGSPEITVPLYIDEELGPQGATFAFLPGKDNTAVKLAYSFEQFTTAREEPTLK